MYEEYDQKTIKFLTICGENGINFKTTSGGVRFQDCPNCGCSRYKTFLYTSNGPLLGACAKCGWRFSAKSFLIESGFEDIVNEACGLDTSMEIETVKNTPEQKHENPNDAPLVEKPNYWISIDDDPDIPPSKYALKRHVTEPIYNRVMIDTQEDGVVFLVTDTKNREIGWQIRFRVPKDPKFKTKTMPGFKAHENLFYLINKNNQIVLVEGPMDAVAAYKLGYSAACFFGSDPSIKQMNIVEYLLLYYSIPEVIVCFDQDEPGVKASLKAASYLEENDIKYIFGTPEEGKDISESLDKGKGITLSNTQNVTSLVFTDFKGKSNAYKSF